MEGAGWDSAREQLPEEDGEGFRDRGEARPLRHLAATWRGVFQEDFMTGAKALPPHSQKELNL